MAVANRDRIINDFAYASVQNSPPEAEHQPICPSVRYQSDTPAPRRANRVSFVHERARRYRNAGPAGAKVDRKRDASDPAPTLATAVPTNSNVASRPGKTISLKLSAIDDLSQCQLWGSDCFTMPQTNRQQASNTVRTTWLQTLAVRRSHKRPNVLGTKPYHTPTYVPVCRHSGP